MDIGVGWAVWIVWGGLGIVATLGMESESGEHVCWGRDLAESVMVPGAALWVGLRVHGVGSV